MCGTKNRLKLAREMERYVWQKGGLFASLKSVWPNPRNYLKGQFYHSKMSCNANLPTTEIVDESILIISIYS